MELRRSWIGIVSTNRPPLNGASKTGGVLTWFLITLAFFEDEKEDEDENECS
jgi:hypothetical protein